MRTSQVLVGGAFSALGLVLAGCGGSQAQDMSGYNTRSMDTSSNAVTSGTSFGAATLGSKMLPLSGKPGFIVGINVPSFTGQPSHELGKNSLEPNAEVSYNSKLVGSALQDIAIAGCNAVKINLFQKLDGLTFDSSGLVSGMDDTYLKNLSDLLSKAEPNKLQMYLCLSPDWSAAPSIKSPLTDPAARTAYFKKALGPLVGKLKGRANIVALEVVDEVESAVSGKDGNSTDKGITWDQARDFIKAASDIVKSVDPQRLVTASSGLHGWQNVQSGKFGKLGLDFYDFHVFDDAGNLPPVKDLKLDRPVLVGSCGQSSKKTDNDIQAKADLAFLTNAQKLGYAGALLSDYDKDSGNIQSVFDKDGKHRPVYAQIQSFAATLAMNATTTPVGSLGK